MFARQWWLCMCVLCGKTEIVQNAGVTHTHPKYFIIYNFHNGGTFIHIIQNMYSDSDRFMRHTLDMCAVIIIIYAICNTMKMKMLSVFFHKFARTVYEVLYSVCKRLNDDNDNAERKWLVWAIWEIILYLMSRRPSSGEPGGARGWKPSVERYDGITVRWLMYVCVYFICQNVLLFVFRWCIQYRIYFVLVCRRSLHLDK